MSEVRNQVQTLQGSEILASQLSSIGGKIFANAEETQVDFFHLVRWWQTIHAPTFGFPIPSSSANVTGDDTTPTILTPGTNETAYIQGLSLVNNNGTDLASVTITVGDATVYAQDVGPGETAVVVGAGFAPFFLVGGQSIAIAVTGVSAGDLAYKLAYSLSVQG